VVIGVTGGVGSGKSTVAKMLGELGAEVVSLDQIGHELLSDARVKEEIRSEFSSGVFRAAAEEVNRERLAKVVFSDPREIGRLNRIVHPRMVERVRESVERFMASNPEGVLVVEGALVVELGLDELCDRTLFVDAPAEVRYSRAESARGWDPGEAARRESAQQPVEKKRQIADTVMDNPGDTNQLNEKVLDFWEEIHHG